MILSLCFLRHKSRRVLLLLPSAARSCNQILCQARGLRRRMAIAAKPGLFEGIFAQEDHWCCLGCCRLLAVSGNEGYYPVRKSLDHLSYTAFLFQGFCFMAPGVETGWSMEAVSAGDNRLGACTAMKNGLRLAGGRKITRAGGERRQ